jgi:hypothetical protein
MLIAGIYYVLKWPFDPPNEFEKRRIRMKREFKKIVDDFNTDGRPSDP